MFINFRKGICNKKRNEFRYYQLSQYPKKTKVNETVHRQMNRTKYQTDVLLFSVLFLSSLLPP